MVGQKSPANHSPGWHDKESAILTEASIEKLNNLDMVEFSNHYIKHGELQYHSDRAQDNPALEIELKAADEMTGTELKACFDLIATTSRRDYEGSSFGWHPRRKKREMKEDEMRYLLVRSKPSAPHGAASPTDSALAPVEGFLSFMLTHDSTPSVPVLYVYEIHLAEPLRRCGLGRHLMASVETIARRVRVQKTMLTCFVSNAKARAFYEKRGYGTDACSPEDRRTRRTIVKADYVIMSKTIQEKSRVSQGSTGEAVA